MTDQEEIPIATKAPENDAKPEEDAKPQSAFPGDSQVPQGASLGATEHCVTDRPTPAGEVPTGDMTKLNGVEVYIAKPSDYPHSPSKVLLLLTGGTGLKSTNNQLQADKYAAEGFLVIMPDQFDGDPAPNTSTTVEEADPSIIKQVKLRAAETAKSFLIDMWLARHTPEKVLPLLHKVVEGAKEEFADAIASGGGIYAVGYCFGAKYVVILGGEHADSVAWGQAAPGDEEQGQLKREPLIKAGAIAHATDVRAEELEAVRVPMCLVCVENDPVFPNEIREAGKKALEKNGVEHELEVYPGVPHGFAVIGDYEDEKIKGEQRRAFSQLLGWIKAH